MRYLINALDIAGAGLAASGLVLLAYLVHPYFAIFTAGALCILAAAVLDPRRSIDPRKVRR